MADWDIILNRETLKGRSFLLGNSGAFSLCLPAASGPSPQLMHPHKWFGAYLYGRKLLEGQVVRLPQKGDVLLCVRNQTQLRVGESHASREYEVDGVTCTETYFVPHGLRAIVCTLDGNTSFVVEPEFDIRFSRAPGHGTEGYEVWMREGGAVVSNVIPAGTYDDATETFHAGSAEGEDKRAYVAVLAAGGGTRVEARSHESRGRRKHFRTDHRRRRFVMEVAQDADAADHAPLWHQSESRVYVPVRLHLDGPGTVVYGFGASAEEAWEAACSARDQLPQLQQQKAAVARDTAEHARFHTGHRDTDMAYRHVLSRFMEALVARSAVAEDTSLDRPATMILAGNRYFHDSWKRDENIALGCLLALGFYDLARNLIDDTWQLQDSDTGRLPQRIRAGETPPYHSSDGTLWAALRLYQYWRRTGDWSLLDAKLPMLRTFFERSLGRTVAGLLPSGRTTAPDYLWETWMDTPHTPRHGFPVEIQMLWIACLERFGPLLRGVNCDLAERMDAAATEARASLDRFRSRGTLIDGLDEAGEPVELITPNPYFCFALPLNLDPVLEGEMRRIGRTSLVGTQGIATLAPQDWHRVFPPQFLQDRRTVRGRRMRSVGKFNYHRGVEWNWLSQFFVRADLKYGDADAAFRTYLRRQVDGVLRWGGVGGVSELFDLSGPRGPEFQAWSMSGFLEAIAAFAGAEIDVPQRRIALQPQLPGKWPYLQTRQWYGRTPFDVDFRAAGGHQTLTVTFGEGVPEDVDVTIAFTLPSRHGARQLQMVVDGVEQEVGWRDEPIPGTDRRRVSVTVQSARRIEMALVHAPAVRMRRTA